MFRHSLVLGILAAIAGAASAQPGGVPGYNPAQSPVSPYLNLLRPGNSPGFNYYGLVRPQMQMQNDLSGLQQQVTSNRLALNDINGALTPTTGHSTFFMNTGGYFPNRSSGAMGARPGMNAGRSSSPPTGGANPGAATSTHP